jgi:hypothetical protein
MRESHQAARRPGSAPRRLASLLLTLVAAIGLTRGSGLTAPAAEAAPRTPSVPADHDNVLARFNATWPQISARFRDAPRALLFEGVNEPDFEGATDAQKAQLLNELNTSPPPCCGT